MASYWFATTFVSPYLPYLGVRAMKFGTFFFEFDSGNSKANLMLQCKLRFHCIEDHG